MLLFFFYPYRDLKPEHHQVCDQNDSSFTVIIRASVHTVSPPRSVQSRLAGDRRAPEASWRVHAPRLRGLVAGETTLPRGPFVPERALPSGRRRPQEPPPPLCGAAPRRQPRPPAPAHPAMAGMQDEQRGGAPLAAQGPAGAEVKLILYHWTHSFSSQKVKASRGAGGADGVSAPGQLPRRPARPPT